MRSSSIGSPDASARLRQPGRHRILLAAEAVFIGEGFAGARMDAIAARAGVSRSHLYYHFKSKDELLDALIELRTADLLTAKTALLDATPGPMDTDLPELIRQAIQTVLVPHRDFLRLLIGEAIRRDELPEAIGTLVDLVLDDTLRRLTGQNTDEELRFRVYQMLVLPAVLAVALPGDPTGHLTSPADLAGLLADTERLLLGPVEPSGPIANG